MRRKFVKNLGAPAALSFLLREWQLTANELAGHAGISHKFTSNYGF